MNEFRMDPNSKWYSHKHMVQEYCMKLSLISAKTKSFGQLVLNLLACMT